VIKSSSILLIHMHRVHFDSTAYTCAHLVTRLPSELGTRILKFACVDMGTMSVLVWAKQQYPAFCKDILVRQPYVRSPVVDGPNHLS
jgi:hypothetical protein